MPSLENLESKAGRAAIASTAIWGIMEVAGVPFSSVALLATELFSLGWICLHFNPFRRHQAQITQ